jgi:8-oxo-dGTP diphosphatase
MGSEPDSSKDYHYPAITVDVVIFTLQRGELHVLLVQRKHPPFADAWAIPGGFVHEDETLEAAARRELAEETGVRDVYLEQLYTFGDPDRDPRGRVISVGYIALVRSERQRLAAASDAADVRWFPADELPQPLAFDHDRIMRYAVDRLRSKLEYTTLAFQLLPEVFSLPELKQIYEQILGEPLDRGNFYRKIKAAELLEETSGFREGKGRPARLYRFRAEAREGDFVFRWREARVRDADDAGRNGAGLVDEL